MHLHDNDERSPEARRTKSPEQQAQHDQETARRAVAERSTLGVGSGAMLHLQRTVGNAATQELVDEAPSARSPVLDVVGHGGGQPLQAVTRDDMERHLGTDLSDVRVHTDGQAAASAGSVGASAYTVGNDIVFNEGGYRPDTDSGRQALVHELTHVVQQRSGPVDGTPTGDGIALSDPGDRFERQAQSNAEAFAAHHTHDADASSPAAVQAMELEEAAAPAVQRQETPEEEEEPPT